MSTALVPYTTKTCACCDEAFCCDPVQVGHRDGTWNPETFCGLLCAKIFYIRPIYWIGQHRKGYPDANAKKVR